MHLVNIARQRHTCKAFDPARRLADADLAALQTLLIHTPSSVNAQPWRFVVTGNDAGRARILAAMTAPVHAANANKVRHASHTVVICARTCLDDAHLSAVLDAEEQAGRFASAPDAKASQDKGRRYYVTLHQEQGDEADWLRRQTYIALGMLLMGAASLGIDACSMEGFDARALDQALGFIKDNQEPVYRACLVVALGYRSPEDFNARLNKARLSPEYVWEEI
jgi:nitroreductase/dihydropteridine reductase